MLDLDRCCGGGQYDRRRRRAPAPAAGLGIDRYCTSRRRPGAASARLTGDQRFLASVSYEQGDDSEGVAAGAATSVAGFPCAYLRSESADHAKVAGVFTRQAPARPRAWSGLPAPLYPAPGSRLSARLLAKVRADALYEQPEWSAVDGSLEKRSYQLA